MSRRNSIIAPTPLDSRWPPSPIPSSLLPQPPTPHLPHPSYRTTQTLHTPHPLNLTSKAFHTTPDDLRQLETNWRERRRRRLEESLSRRRRVDRGLMRMSLSSRRETVFSTRAGMEEEQENEDEAESEGHEQPQRLVSERNEQLDRPSEEQKTPRRGRSFRPCDRQPLPTDGLIKDAQNPRSDDASPYPIPGEIPQPLRNPLLGRFIRNQTQTQTRSDSLNTAHRTQAKNIARTQPGKERGKVEADVSRSSSVRFSLPPSPEKQGRGLQGAQKHGQVGVREEAEVAQQGSEEEEGEEDVEVVEVTGSTIKPFPRSDRDVLFAKAQNPDRKRERPKPIELHPLPPGTYHTLISSTNFPSLRLRNPLALSVARTGVNTSSVPVRVIIYPSTIYKASSGRGQTDTETLKPKRIATLLLSPSKRIHLLSPGNAFTYVYQTRYPSAEGRNKTGEGKLRWMRETCHLDEREVWDKGVKGIWEGTVGVLEKVKGEVDRAVYNLPEGHLHISCSSPPIITFYTSSSPSVSSTEQNPTIDSQTTQMTLLPAEGNQAGTRAKVVFDSARGVCKIHTIIKERSGEPVGVRKGKMEEKYRSRRTIEVADVLGLRTVLLDIERGRTGEGEPGWHAAEVKALRDFVDVSGVWAGKK